MPVPPTYAAAFHCIGPACEDSCCHDWNIPLDRATYARYRQFPPQRLGVLVERFVSISPAPQPNLYAQIDVGTGCDCPFFGADRLCRIQKEHGQALLSATCSIYPRVLNEVAGRLEGTLSLSCPEAARNILLVPRATETQGDLLAGGFRTDNVFHLLPTVPATKPYGTFEPIRALLIATIQDRSQPIWQRVLLIGALCEQLATCNGDDTKAAQIVSRFNPTQATQRLERTPADPAKKLELILKLFADRTARPRAGRRFRDAFWTFIEGIGTPLDASPEQAIQSDLDRLQHAQQTWLEPFLAAHPHLLENYLLNHLYSQLFPFGREGSPLFPPHGIFDEYLLLATRFAWVTTMLAGIAAQRRQAFSSDDAVAAIQSLTRAVEHYPDALADLLATLRRHNLASLEGTAILLKP